MVIDAGGLRLEWRDFAEMTGAMLYEVLRFRQAIFVVEQRSPYPDLDGADQRAHHLLLWRDDSITAYLRVIPYPAEARVAIGRVAVAAPWRRRGLALRLMTEALALCRRDYRDDAVTLSAQAYLAAFYETLGFRIMSAPYDDYGVPHVDMAKTA